MSVSIWRCSKLGFLALIASFDLATASSRHSGAVSVSGALRAWAANPYRAWSEAFFDRAGRCAQPSSRPRRDSQHRSAILPRIYGEVANPKHQDHTDRRLTRAAAPTKADAYRRSPTATSASACSSWATRRPRGRQPSRRSDYARQPETTTVCLRILATSTSSTAIAATPGQRPTASTGGARCPISWPGRRGRTVAASGGDRAGR